MLHFWTRRILLTEIMKVCSTTLRLSLSAIKGVKICSAKRVISTSRFNYDAQSGKLMWRSFILSFVTTFHSLSFRRSQHQQHPRRRSQRRRCRAIPPWSQQQRRQQQGRGSRVRHPQGERRETQENGTGLQRGYRAG